MRSSSTESGHPGASSNPTTVTEGKEKSAGRIEKGREGGRGKTGAEMYQHGGVLSHVSVILSVCMVGLDAWYG